MGKMFIERTVYQEKNARIVILQDNNKSWVASRSIQKESIVGKVLIVVHVAVRHFSIVDHRRRQNVVKTKTEWHTSCRRVCDWHFPQHFEVFCDLLGTLRSDDGDGNGNATKAIGLISKTTILHVTSRLCSHCTTTTWKCLISRCTEEVHKRPRNFLSALGYVS